MEMLRQSGCEIKLSQLSHLIYAWEYKMNFPLSQLELIIMINA